MLRLVIEMDFFYCGSRRLLINAKIRSAWIIRRQADKSHSQAPVETTGDR
jgi:hypothetical protein